MFNINFVHTNTSVYSMYIKCKSSLLPFFLPYITRLPTCIYLSISADAYRQRLLDSSQAEVSLSLQCVIAWYPADTNCPFFFTAHCFTGHGEDWCCSTNPERIIYGYVIVKVLIYIIDIILNSTLIYLFCQYLFICYADI